MLSHFNNAIESEYGYLKNKYIYCTFNDEFNEYFESKGAS
jgi:hypothetical protein